MSLAQGNNTPTRPRIEPGSPDPESNAYNRIVLGMRSYYRPFYTSLPCTSCRDKAIPEDIAKTLKPQTLHIPRSTCIPGEAVQDLVVSGHSKTKVPILEEAPRSVKSTSYNQVRGQPLNWHVCLFCLMFNDAPTLMNH